VYPTARVPPRRPRRWPATSSRIERTATARPREERCRREHGAMGAFSSCIPELMRRVWVTAMVCKSLKNSACWRAPSWRISLARVKSRKAGPYLPPLRSIGCQPRIVCTPLSFVGNALSPVSWTINTGQIKCPTFFLERHPADVDHRFAPSMGLFRIEVNRRRTLLCRSSRRGCVPR